MVFKKIYDKSELLMKEVTDSFLSKRNMLKDHQNAKKRRNIKRRITKKIMEMDKVKIKEKIVEYNFKTDKNVKDVTVLSSLLEWFILTIYEVDEKFIEINVDIDVQNEANKKNKITYVK